MLRKQKLITISISKTKYITLSIYARENLQIIQILKDTNYAKYLKDLLNYISIIKNKIYKFVFFIQLIDNN